MDEYEWLVTTDVRAMFKQWHGSSATPDDLLSLTEQCLRPIQQARKACLCVCAVLSIRAGTDNILRWEDRVTEADRHLLRFDSESVRIRRLLAERYLRLRDEAVLELHDLLLRTGYLPYAFRDILGNPFGRGRDWGLFRTTIPPERVLVFQDGLIPGLARSIYDSNDWGSLDPLIDALQEAGVPHRGDVIQHLLGNRLCMDCRPMGSLVADFAVNGPAGEATSCLTCNGTGWVPLDDPRHHRGCWVMDTILGKE